MRLSACMIMRDAEKDLPDALGSLAGNVDEIVVVDTGSEDGSVGLARRYTDKVYSFPWQEDFAAARNFCMDKATGDWIFFLDSDEYVTEETRGNLRRIAESLDAQGYELVDVRRENVDENHVLLQRPGDFAMRLFRKDGNRRYCGPIHEYLACDGKPKSGAVSPKDLCICHKGYSPSRVHGKYLRNVRMLEGMEARGQQHKFQDYYLAGLYFSEKEFEKALPHAQRAVETGALPEFDSFGSWRIWHACLEALEKSEAEQERVLRAGMGAYPRMPDFFIQYGALLMRRGDFAGALDYLGKGEQFLDHFAENCPREQNPLGTPDNRARLYGMMSDVCAKLGQEDRGRKYADRKWALEFGIDGETGSGYSAYIPPKSRSVVEFSCGKGETGRAFLRIQPECRYMGLETDRELLEEAGRHLSLVAAESPETMDFSSHGLGKMDCILYGERSIHGLTLDILRKHGEHLSPEGQMVFVLENPGYFHYAVPFLGGREASFSGGTSLGALQRMVAGAGMQVFSVQPLYETADEAEKERPETQAFLRALHDWCRSTGEDAKGDVWARRYVVRAVRGIIGKGMFFQTILGETVATSRIRIEEPNAFLQTVPGFLCHSEAGVADMGRARPYDRKVLLRQRVSFQDTETALSQIAMIRKAGYLLSYELDDSPVHWAEGHKKSKYLDYIGVHVIQVSTPALAEEMRRYNPHVAVFRNELRELPSKRVYDEGRPLTIFFGALNREKEWSNIMPVLNEAAKRYGEGLQFCVLADHAFFDALRTPHKKFIGCAAYYGGRFVPYEVYEQVLHRADISLLPLRDTPFNRGKSDLKFIESAGHGAVVLASPTVYAATVRDGRTGFLYRSPREFRERLMLLLEDRSRLRETAGAAYDYVRRERLLCQHYEERRMFYEEMLDRREELDRELEERLNHLKDS